MAVTSEGTAPVEVSQADVTVVIGTYNGERHLREQLESVVRQTLTPVEILVCDDGSTDRTLELIEDFRASSPVPVRVVRNPTRLGFADNFLHGARLVTSRFVAFCDQDDRWRPDKLEVGRAALVEHDASVCAHAVELIDEDGVLRGADDQGITATRVVEPLTADPWKKYFGFTLLFERALLDVVPMGERGPDTHVSENALSHDRWVCFLGLSLGRGVLVHEALAQYRQHDSQLFGSLEARVGWLRRAGNRLRHYVASVRGTPQKAASLADVCYHRANLLAAAYNGDRSTLDRAAERWRLLGDHYSARSALYGPMSLTRRVRALLGLIRTGVYGPSRRGGLGPRALLQDVGVCALAVVAPGR